MPGTWPGRVCASRCWNDIYSFATSLGVDVEIDMGVEEVLVEGKKAIGVVTADGRKITSSVVAANIHPQTLLLKPIDPTLLQERDHQRISNYRSHSATFRMNVALGELPRFSKGDPARE